MSLEGHVSGQSNKPLTQPAHSLTWRDVSEQLRADVDDGLSTEEAQKRLDEYGRNELGDGQSINPGKIVVRQIANAMTLVLIIAMIVSFAIKSWIEGGVVAGVIFINVTVGFFQEYKAEKTMDSLRSLSSPTAQAVRNGQSISIATVEIVPGDLVELKTGDTIPADVRLVDAVNFETDEALLTGESLPVRKSQADVFDIVTGPGDRLNIAYSSSTVTKGRATGIVFATGMYTEIGSIAAALRKKNKKIRPVKRNEDGTTQSYRYLQAAILTLYDGVGHFLGVNVGTPLQKKLSRLACLLFIIAVICAIIVLAANDFKNETEVIIYAVATGLSMIPASLVVVLTITMAAGTNRMVERHVIVRNLRSLEALGAVTDICSDKTGTLTQGKMVAKKAWIPACGTFTVEEIDEPLNPTQGEIFAIESEPRNMNFRNLGRKATTAELIKDNRALEEYLRVASLANLANVHKAESGSWNAHGDPTEIAMQVFASRFDYNRRKFVSGDKPSVKLLVEFPFDSDVKKMSAIYQDEENKMFVFTKGAVERVIASCTSYYDNQGRRMEMTDGYRETILANMEALAAGGLRVLALGSREYTDNYTEGKEIDRGSVEHDLTFRGLIGLYDPPRPESAPSVQRCHEAGIEVHMLTGDHPGTARAIAAQVGILPRNMHELGKDVADSMVMTASQFDALSESEIDRLPVLPLVIARCSPNTKVNMIEALHRRGRFCAMTGDGVNDSPSLKRADVGIAMGQAGSDVAKDASDIILTDDNFASILAAIEEGRRTFDNIQKFVLHLLAQNVCQALVLLIGLVFKDREELSVYPISPIEILWIIMITSGLPDMGLGFQEKAPDVLRRPPQSLKRGIFTIELLIDMVFYGLLIAALCLVAFVLVLYPLDGNGRIGVRCNESIDDGCDVIFRARATCFSCLVWFSVFLAWEVIDMRKSFFRMKPDSKHYFTQWMRDVWRNQFLFWAVVAAVVLTFPILYIPVINSKVFRHTGISWEWSIVFISSLVFFVTVEAWKWGKRVWFRRMDARNGRSGAAGFDGGLENKMFERYLSQTSAGVSDNQSKELV